jgi:hypothetical protein
VRVAVRFAFRAPLAAWCQQVTLSVRSVDVAACQ